MELRTRGSRFELESVVFSWSIFGWPASIEKAGKAIQTKVKDQVSDQIGKALGNDEAGQEAGKMLDEQGQKLLKDLFGNQ